MITYQPKGGMCGVCIHLSRNCGLLNFSEMQRIGKYPDGTIVVKCTDFKRVKDT